MYIWWSRGHPNLISNQLNFIGFIKDKIIGDTHRDTGSRLLAILKAIPVPAKKTAYQASEPAPRWRYKRGTEKAPDNFAPQAGAIPHMDWMAYPPFTNG